MSNNLQKRFISAIVLAALFLLGIFVYRPLFTFLLALVAIIMLAEWFDMTKGSRAISLSGLIIIPLPITAILLISLLDRFGWLLLTLSLTVSIVDISAMFGGKFLKGPKLAPKVSPKKTISGLATAIFAAALVPSALSLLPGFDLSYIISPELSLLELSVSCACLAIISQLSDLFVSLFKRHFKIKDTGSIIPGHGGILDRFDSYIFAAPIALIFILSNI